MKPEGGSVSLQKVQGRHAYRDAELKREQGVLLLLDILSMYIVHSLIIAAGSLPLAHNTQHSTSIMINELGVMYSNTRMTNTCSLISMYTSSDCLGTVWMYTCTYNLQKGLYKSQTHVQVIIIVKTSDRRTHNYYTDS